MGAINASYDTPDAVGLTKKQRELLAIYGFRLLTAKELADRVIAYGKGNGIDGWDYSKHVLETIHKRRPLCWIDAFGMLRSTEGIKADVLPLLISDEMLADMHYFGEGVGWRECEKWQAEQLSDSV